MTPAEHGEDGPEQLQREMDALRRQRLTYLIGRAVKLLKKKIILMPRCM